MTAAKIVLLKPATSDVFTDAAREARSIGTDLVMLTAAIDAGQPAPALAGGIAAAAERIIAMFTPAAPDPARHNHPVGPFAPLEAPGACPRCDERRAARAARGVTDHNHESRPFGRLLPAGECPRCDELRDGAPAREGHAARRQRQETQDDAGRTAHFARGGPHDRGACGPVCTAFDW